VSSEPTTSAQPSQHASARRPRKPVARDGEDGGCSRGTSRTPRGRAAVQPRVRTTDRRQAHAQLTETQRSATAAGSASSSEWPAQRRTARTWRLRSTLPGRRRCRAPIGYDVTTAVLEPTLAEPRWVAAALAISWFTPDKPCWAGSFPPSLRQVECRSRSPPESSAQDARQSAGCRAAEAVCDARSVIRCAPGALTSSSLEMSGYERKLQGR
jgi:hypothetical protein